MLIERAIRIFIFVLNIIIFTFLLCICLPELFLLSLKNSILKRLICLNFLFTLVQYIYSIKIILILLYSDWLKVFYLIIFSFLNFSIIKFIFNCLDCSRMLKISKQMKRILILKWRFTLFWIWMIAKFFKKQLFFNLRVI